jgi:uncharacterized protein YacL
VLLSVSPWVRVTGGLILGLVGWRVGAYFVDGWGNERLIIWVVVFALVGVVVGVLLSPLLIGVPMRRARQWFWGLNPYALLLAVAGLIVGLTLAALLSMPLSRAIGWPVVWLPVILSAVLGYLGAAIAVWRQDEFVNLLPIQAQTAASSSGKKSQILVDTSSIIDGRIADITQTGFVQGTLVIPRFVLDELRHIADSSDSVRRNRGRRGLEMLNRLRKEAQVPIQVLDVDVNDDVEVDAKLVKLARSMSAQILTTDFNLNRVAELQGVKVLNVNQLASSLKPVVIPGEEMNVRVTQEGKEVGQGVAFLEDGTMIVVEGGRRYLHSLMDVQVVRVLQTVAGRIIFAHIKGS